MIYEKWIAERAKELPFSGIRKIFEIAGKLEREGKEIIHLEIGRPDFDTPVHIKEAAKKALDSGKVHYTSNYGLLELREAIAKKFFDDNKISVNPEDEIIVTVGVSEANFTIMASLIEKGDEVIIPTPCWPTYLTLPAFFGAKMVTIPLYTDQGFQLDLERIEKAISPRTKLLIVASPSNPTGIVFNEDLIKGLAELALRYNLLVLSDEIYEKIIYDGNKHMSIGSLPGMKERTIIVNGFSKAYSMTGWRLGYIAAPSDLIKMFIRVHQRNTTCAASFAQFGAIAALTGDQGCILDMVAEFNRRKKLLIDSFNHLPGIKCVNPGGAFYVFPDFTEYGINSEDLTLFFLEKAEVAVVPGSTFGPGGETCIRISYANSYENIARAIEKMSACMEEL